MGALTSLTLGRLFGEKRIPAGEESWTEAIEAGWADEEVPGTGRVGEPESVDISGESGIINEKYFVKYKIDEVSPYVIKDMDVLLEIPQIVLAGQPDEWYSLFRESGYNPKPLGKGRYEGIRYEDGGGFRIHWGGDCILQYHPPKGHHGEKSYWKVSSGKTGTIRFDLDGNILP